MCDCVCVYERMSVRVVPGERNPSRATQSVKGNRLESQGGESAEDQEGCRKGGSGTCLFC